MTVNFTDASTCVTSWNWNFGDNGTSTSQNPSHTYSPILGNNLAVSYTVSLTATGPGGSNEITKVNYITAQCSNPPVKNITTGVMYSTLQSAYNAASSGDTIRSHAVTFVGSLTVDKDISVTLDGGYGCDYQNKIGNTALKGQLQTKSGGGTLTIKNFVLEQ